MDKLSIILENKGSSLPNSLNNSFSLSMKKIINPGVFYNDLRVLSLRITNLFNSGPRLMKSAYPGNFVIDNKNFFSNKKK